MTNDRWEPDGRIAPVCVNPAKSFQAVLGNGELGLQASDSGLAGSRSFLVGVVDLTPNDLQRMALLPTWNAIGLRLPGGPSLEDAFVAGRHTDYRQQLDTATATLRTQYAVDLGGRRLRVETASWLSRADRHLAVVQVRLTAEVDVELEADVGVTANPTVERHPFRSLVWPHVDYPRQYAHGFHEQRMTYAWHPGHMDVVAVGGGDASWGVAAVAAHDGPAVGVAIAVAGDIESVAKAEAEAGDARGTLRLRLKAGSTREVVLYAAFARDDRPERLLAAALHAARAARVRGHKALYAEHASAWAGLWGGEVRVEGDVQLDRQARLDLFMLYQNAPVDRRFPMQIMGLAAPGYYGNVGCAPSSGVSLLVVWWL